MLVGQTISSQLSFSGLIQLKLVVRFNLCWIILEWITFSIQSFKNSFPSLSRIVLFHVCHVYSVSVTTFRVRESRIHVLFPVEFESCLNQLYKMYPEEDHILDLELESFPLKIMIEILIVSMIGLFLRMLFGLDDVTEKHQSRFAAKVNGILSRHLNPEESLDPRTEWTQLFDIKEWFRHIRYRTSFAEQEKLNPIQFRHGKPPNLTRLSDISTRYATPGK